MAKKARSLHQAMFDLLAPLYDLGFWLIALFFGGEKAVRDRTVEEAMPLAGMTVLESFAGTATVSIMAAQRGASAVAQDISSGMLSVALEKSRKSGVELMAVRADSSSLPFRDSSFDRVIASFGLHEAHSETVRAFFTESLRVLKKNGRLVVIDYHKAGGKWGLVEKLLFTFVETDHASEWVGMDAQGLIRDAGFKDFRRRFLIAGGVQLITAVKR